jgi:hypothetical protein
VTDKWNAFLAYAPFDALLCHDQATCATTECGDWMLRQYTVASESGAGAGAGGGGGAGGLGGAGGSGAAGDAGAAADSGGGGTGGAPAETNVALTATAAASSENASTGQTAAKSIDGVVDGTPGDPTKSGPCWAVTPAAGCGSPGQRP